LAGASNASGVINRTIRDKKDDGSFERPRRNFGWGEDQLNTPDTGVDADYHYLNQMMDTGILPDGQPDVFSFSFPGHSGKFIRPTMQSIQLLPIQPLDISFSGQEPSTNGVRDMAKWTIIDEKGQLFEFGATEISERAHGRDVASWFLAHMTSVSGRDVLDFEYSKPHEYTMSVVQSETHIRSLSGQPISRDRNVSMPFKMFTRHLKAIRFAEGSIEFYASDRGRQDVPGEVKLDSVVVRDRSGRATKRIALIYRPRAESCRAHEVDHRYGVDAGGQHSTHHFTYNAIHLPHPESLVQDHWGFFNRNLEDVRGIDYQGLGGSLIPADTVDLVDLRFRLEARFFGSVLVSTRTGNSCRVSPCGQRCFRLIEVWIFPPTGTPGGHTTTPFGRGAW
jgi:hypothetical protein